MTGAVCLYNRSTMWNKIRTSYWKSVLTTLFVHFFAAASFDLCPMPIGVVN